MQRVWIIGPIWRDGMFVHWKVSSRTMEKDVQAGDIPPLELEVAGVAFTHGAAFRQARRAARRQNRREAQRAEEEMLR